MAAIPTRRVRLIAGGPAFVINASDFNPATHADADQPVDVAQRFDVPVEKMVAVAMEPGAVLRMQAELYRAGYSSGYADGKSGRAMADVLNASRFLNVDPILIEPTFVAQAAVVEPPVAVASVVAPSPAKVDVTPGSIATVNMDEALALVAAATTLDELSVLSDAEKANQKKPGGRKGLMEAIAERLTALAEAT
jgi:hypothetical protein